MGYKRPLDAYCFEKLPFKQSQGFDCGSDLPSSAETNPHYSSAVKPLNFGHDEDCYFDIQWYDAVKKGEPSELTHANYKVGETNTPLSSYSEDDTGSGATLLSSLSTDSFEIECPLRKSFPFVENDFYLNDSPRRLVPVGPNHQASIPTWLGSVDKMSDRTSSVLGATKSVVKGEKVMGEVIISMPKQNFSHEDDHAGDGRLDCDCMDFGSVRCVRQHVMEAREIMKKTLGYENFTNLGFHNMGEGVACKWTEEEEDAFHEIVYSYPASLGRNFWKHLSAVFPSQTNKELVRYYFNVFMLRKRAAQNRSKLHDIDSDDDELHGSDTIRYHPHVSEDEDSAIESLDNQDVLERNPKHYSEDPVDDEGDEDAADDVANSPGEYVNVNPSEACMMSQVAKECNHPDKIEQVVKEDLSLEDDSCMSFDCENSMVRHCDSLSAAASLQGGGFKSNDGDPLAGKGDCSSDMVNHSYFIELCDSKDWCPRYLTGLTNDVDFLPTSNIIEEIFGEGSPEKKQKIN